VATGEGEKKMCESKKVLIEVVVQVECTRTIHIYRVYLLSAIVGKGWGWGRGVSEIGTLDEISIKRLQRATDNNPSAQH